MSDSRRHTALLITFYWPPSGGPGVHRWLRFSRFFRENDWDLHVYCPEEAAWPIVDPALLDEVPDDITVVRRKIFEPHKYLGKKNNPNVGGGLTKQKKSSLFQRFVIWVRGNLFIPDARVFWIKPSARFLNNYLAQHPEIDTIISSGPPHSLHLIARKLKKKHPRIKWVADFRDPWTEIDFYQDLLPGKRADEKHRALEKTVLQEADLVITISEACAEGLDAIAGRPVEVFTNGFIFPEFDPKSVRLEEHFTIAHYGSMPFARNPEAVWKALAELVRDEQFAHSLVIRLVGPVDFAVLERIRENGLEQWLELIPTVSHSTSLELQRTTPVLLLIANNTGNVKGILTGKFFEYLGAKRPILAIGQKDSNLEDIVNETDCGVFADYENVGLVVSTLKNWFELHQQRQLYKSPVNTQQFASGAILAKLLARLEIHVG